MAYASANIARCIPELFKQDSGSSDVRVAHILFAAQA